MRAPRRRARTATRSTRLDPSLVSATRCRVIVKAMAASTSIQPPLAKPLLRGVLHQVGFSVSLVLGTLLIIGAGGASERVAASVFAGSVAVCFGLSALYHRVNWRPRVRLWMRRADHAGVYLLIAGTYTPICL